MNYESFIERDPEGIVAAVRDYRRSHTAEELWQAVTRFAVLAYAPSQHAKRAVLSCLAAWELRDVLDGPAFDELVLECARYTAESRQPWSEPPIFEAPQVDPSHPRDAAELRAAVAAHDRLRAEQWLAARIDDRALARDLFAVAADDVRASGDALLVTVAAWKLAALLGEKGRVVALRIAMWELTAAPAASARLTATTVGDDALLPQRETLLQQLIDELVGSNGDITAAQMLFLFDAAVEAGAIAGDPSIAQRVHAQLSAERPASSAESIPLAAAAPMSYRLARDYGTCLYAHAVARRLAKQFPAVDATRIVAAAGHNLAHGSSFEDFAFA